MGDVRRRASNWKRDLVVVFALALLPRLALAACVSVRPAWDGAIYERAASQLAHGEGYTQRALRLDAPARPTAYYPVGWPAMMAAARLAHDSRSSDIALQFLLASLTACASYFLTRRFAASRIALYTACTVAVWPSLIFVSHSWMSETSFTFLLLLAILPVARARRRHQPAALVAACLVLSAAALVRPVALVAGLLLILSRLRFRDARSWLIALLATAALLAPLAPWAVRNSYALGSPVLISTNGGTNLLVGTLEHGRFDRIPASIDCPNGLPEVERDRCRRDIAIERILRDKVTYARMAFVKLIDTFAYEASPSLEFAESTLPIGSPRASWALPLAIAAGLPYLILLLVAGACLGRRRIPPSRTLNAFVIAAMGATALVHAATLGGDRYHLPLVPLLLSWCASALSIPYSRNDR